MSMPTMNVTISLMIFSKNNQDVFAKYFLNDSEPKFILVLIFSVFSDNLFF